MSFQPKLPPFAALALLVACCGRLGASDPDVGRGGAGSGGTPGDGGDAGDAHGGTAGVDSEAGGAGVSSGAGGASGGEGGEGGETEPACRDATAEVCMRPPFPNGVVPYAGEPSLPAWVWSAVRGAVARWNGLGVDSTSLRFTEDRAENARSLLFELLPGCGPASLTDEALTVAIAGCPDELGLTRAIGAALGLPRVHQRADRDRYLVMGSREQFRCERGEFFEQCPDLGDVPAELGPFHVAALMFAPGATVPCTPDTYRYVEDAPFSSIDEACAQVKDSHGLGFYDRSALAELYAIDDGWRPFLPIGADAGDEPIQVNLGEGAQPAHHTLVRLDDGELGVFAFTASPGGTGELWFTRRSELRWSAFDDPSAAWAKLADVPSPPVGAVARAGESDVVDLFFETGSETRTARVVLSSESPDVTWSTLERPVSGFVVLAAVPTPRRTAMLYGLSDVEGEHLYVRDTGAPPSEWTTVPGLRSPSILPMVARDGTQHVVSITADGPYYASADAQGRWSSWSALPIPENPPANPSSDFFTGALVEIPGGMALIWTTFAGALWHWPCNAAPCSNPEAWAEPMLLAVTNMPRVVSALSRDPGSLDVVMGFTEERAFEVPAQGLWHKRWEAP